MTAHCLRATRQTKAVTWSERKRENREVMKPKEETKEFVVPRRLRVGVISDSQLTPFFHRTPTTFESNLVAAFKTLKKLDCGLILFAGDICNRASKRGYATYKRALESAFGDDKPVVQSIMGNHDYYAHPCPRRLFERELHQSPFTHFVVNGYHFIGASPDSCSMSRGYKKTRGFIEKELKKAEADGTDRPVFVTVHNAPRGTVYGSDRWGDDSLAGLFDSHPRAVVFSGHTHYSLLDPRSFWQGAFTVFNTQSVSYVEMEKGKANGSVPPYAYTVPMGYVLDFSRDKIVVMRYNMFTGEEQLPDERIILPAESAPAMFPLRRETAAPPRFVASDVGCTQTAQGTEIVFSAASGAHSYDVRYSDGEEQTYFSRFYLGDSAREREERIVLYGKREGRYDITLTATGPYGEKSVEKLNIDGVYVENRKYRRKLAPEIWY